MINLFALKKVETAKMKGHFGTEIQTRKKDHEKFSLSNNRSSLSKFGKLFNKIELYKTCKKVIDIMKSQKIKATLSHEKLQRECLQGSSLIIL